jgi:hypothetical protein
MMRNSYTILVENQNARDHLEDLGIEDEIGIKLVIRKQAMRLWATFN